MIEKINVNELKPGNTFLKNGDVYVVIEISHSKSGRGQAHVKTKVKNLSTGTTNTITFVGGEKVDKAFVTKTKMQYLYGDQINSNFMNSETFDQLEIENKLLKSELEYLKEGTQVLITTYQNKILGIEIPKNVTLKVISTVDAVKGDTVSGATKKATLETGKEVDVPQFINVDDEVIINTETGKYISKG